MRKCRTRLEGRVKPQVPRVRDALSARTFKLRGRRVISLDLGSLSVKVLATVVITGDMGGKVENWHAQFRIRLLSDVRLRVCTVGHFVRRSAKEAVQQVVRVARVSVGAKV